MSLRRQRQVDLSEFQDSLVYRVNSRTARTTTHNS
ncbi:Membrane metallo-endopeptidase-like 1 [Apodemus speciosus]|uniref:Membrane metallo-endopeptidase-like 1 n=1 Tax=Apodemus speciosus TaxID=105296 RepID=A0ABQ0FV43_APOSI